MALFQQSANSKLKMRKTLANIALLAAVTILCLALAVAGLRAFTPFPIHAKKANKIYDRDFGYRLNPGHPTIDKNGFRNRGQKKAVVAVIGDSHTYGSNVRPEQSWPEQFEKMTGEAYVCRKCIYHLRRDDVRIYGVAAATKHLEFHQQDGHLLDPAALQTLLNKI